MYVCRAVGKRQEGGAAAQDAMYVGGAPRMVDDSDEWGDGEEDGDRDDDNDENEVRNYSI